MFLQQELEAVNQILLDIYGTEVLEELCVKVLKRLPELVKHEKVYFCCYNVEETDKAWKVFSENMTEQELDKYFKNQRFDYTSWYLSQSGAGVYRDSDLVSDRAMKESIIFKEWMVPMGMRYCCGNVITVDGIRYGDITMFRSEEKGDYTDRELFLLKLVTDHLCLWFQRNYPMGIVESAGAAYPASVQNVLTEREQQVVRLIQDALSTKEISKELVITDSTTRRHIANIYAKLGVSSRVQLIKKLEEKKW